MATSSSSCVTATEDPQASALVIEFICLFTHDLKRKQKRWQDGALKYHSFNKRIMVYDDHGHFIGDAHWHAGDQIETGDEFELDRGAAIVQVLDYTGQREQDLSELLEKRAKAVEARRTNLTPRTPTPRANVGRATMQSRPSNILLQHRSLIDIVGPPAGIGRAAVSPLTPYEHRLKAQEHEDSTSQVVPKRRKRELSPTRTSCHARSLFGATLNLGPRPSQSVPISRRLAPDKHDRPQRTMPPDNDNASNGHYSVSSESCSTEKTTQKIAPRQKGLQTSTARVTAQARHVHRADHDERDAHVDIAGWPEPPIMPSSQLMSSHEVRRSPRASTENTKQPKFALPQDGPETLGRKPTKADVQYSAVDGTLQASHGTVRPSGQATQAQEIEGNGELRTALRIKSKKRRRLLMVSEKHEQPQHPARTEPSPNAALPSSQAISVVDDPETRQQPEGPTSAEKHCDESVLPKVSRNTSDTQITTGSTDSVDLLTICSDIGSTLEGAEISPKKLARGMRQRGTVNQAADTAICRPDQPRVQGCSKNTTARHESLSKYDSSNERKTKRQEEEDRYSSPVITPAPGASRGPRIARMGRKSVKSREIFGISMSQGTPLVQGHVSIGIREETCPAIEHQETEQTAMQAKKAIPTQSDPSHPALQITSRVDGDTNGNVPDASLKERKQRLNNPATRGRKAATKEDAAGKAPQPLVQLDTVLPTECEPSKRQRPTISTSKPSTLPGFTRANGGAWSRHAEDLLGMTRPQPRQSRR